MLSLFDGLKSVLADARQFVGKSCRHGLIQFGRKLRAIVYVNYSYVSHQSFLALKGDGPWQLSVAKNEF